MKKKVAQAEQLEKKSYSYAYKKQILDAVENGQVSINQAAKLYGLNRSTIQTWMKNIGNFEKKLKQMGGRSAQQEINALRKRIQELESEKIIYDLAFEVIDQELKIDSKKKFLPASLQSFLQSTKKK